MPARLPYLSTSCQKRWRVMPVPRAGNPYQSELARGLAAHGMAVSTGRGYAQPLPFLREALPYYEQPEVIRIRLLQSRDDPRRFIEVVEYDNRSTHDRDQTRVETDPQMRVLLDRWHALLEGSLEIETYEEITELLQGGGGA